MFKAHNYLFKNVYKDISFIEPGNTVLNLYAGYTIGCFDNNLNKNKRNWRTVSLQEIASDILGVEHKKEIPKLILIPDGLNTSLLKEVLNTKIIVPLKGNKNKILKMAYENAKLNVLNNYQKKENIILRSKGANDELGALLGININRIDVFDNSNLFGSFAVSGMVVFIEGLPQTKEYRKYKIKIAKN